MTSKSKAKGNSWELEVAKFLSATYNASFLRVPSSGAYVGGSNNFRKSSLDAAQLQSKKGDIHPPDKWVHFNFECKAYSEFNFTQLWTGDVKILDSWIQQQHEVEDEGDLNLILIKITRKGKWVVYQDNLGFVTDRFIRYKGWCFAAWDNFWNVKSNVDLVKAIATGSNAPSHTAIQSPAP